MKTALTPGARASVELQLQDAQRREGDLAKSRGWYSDQDLQVRALADECACEGKHAQAHAYRAASIRYRAQIIVLDSDLREVRAEVAGLRAKLDGAPEVAPVFLTEAQAAAVDETFGYVREAA